MIEMCLDGKNFYLKIYIKMKKSTSRLLWLAVVLTVVVIAGVVFGGVQENFFAANNACQLDLPCGSYLEQTKDAKGKMVPRCKECIYRNGCKDLKCKCLDTMGRAYKEVTFPALSRIDPDVDLCSRKGNLLFLKGDAAKVSPECGKPASQECVTKNKALLDALKQQEEAAAAAAQPTKPEGYVDTPMPASGEGFGNYEHFSYYM